MVPSGCWLLLAVQLFLACGGAFGFISCWGVETFARALKLLRTRFGIGEIFVSVKACNSWSCKVVLPLCVESLQFIILDSFCRLIWLTLLGGSHGVVRSLVLSGGGRPSAAFRLPTILFHYTEFVVI